MINDYYDKNLHAPQLIPCCVAAFSIEDPAVLVIWTNSNRCFPWFEEKNDDDTEWVWNIIITVMMMITITIIGIVFFVEDKCLIFRPPLLLLLIATMSSLLGGCFRWYMYVTLPNLMLVRKSSKLDRLCHSIHLLLSMLLDIGTKFCILSINFMTVRSIVVIALISSRYHFITIIPLTHFY